MTGTLMPGVAQGTVMFRLMAAMLLCVWTTMVADEDPQESIDLGLAERLGKAISRRRQFFKYREAHRMKLSHGLDYHYLGDAETIASSLPEHLKDKIGTSQISQLPISEDNYSDAGVSQTSYATSAADTEQRRVPPLPVEATKGPFECPFCFTIISVTDRSSWKKHVYGDLWPYVCLYKECMTPEKEFSRRHQWMDHVKQNHWKVYPCPFSCHLTFPSNSECARHVSQSHSGAGTPQELAAMISLSEQPLDIRSGISCPICGVNLDSARQYQSHVGRHQEQLALFALPDLESNNESDTDDEEAWDVESVDVRSDHFETDENKNVPMEDPTSSSSAREIPDHPRTPYNSRSTAEEDMGFHSRNEYFVPRDGIDREVITADICRYLGDTTDVRPGHYENPRTGQIVQGYYINAFRNLTTDMISDLKADSARWDVERRTQTTRNTSGVQYRYSETHQARHAEPYLPPPPHYPGTTRTPYDPDPGYPETSSLSRRGPDPSIFDPYPRPPEPRPNQYLRRS